MNRQGSYVHQDLTESRTSIPKVFGLVRVIDIATI